MADYINKQEVLADLNKTYDKMASFHPQFYNGYQFAVNMLRGFPKADVAEVRHGLWSPVYESEISGWNPEYAGYDPIGDYRCSECGKDAILNCNDKLVLSPYCPNCGARCDMEE